MKNAIRCTLLLMVVGVFVTGCSSKIWYVKPGGSGDGKSWSGAFHSIQDAVDAASEKGGEVWVAGGLYVGERGEAQTGVLKIRRTAKAVQTFTVTLKPGVDLYGGFTGTETSRDARDWETNLTVVDGENTRACVSGANDATLDGFTIQGGYGERGAGLINVQASPTITHCTFTGNTAVGEHAYGAGMYNEGSSPVVSDCTFKANAARAGAGMYNGDSSAPEVSGCTFSENAASTTGGGAVFNGASTPAFANCVFEKNRSGTAGGAIYNLDSSPRCANGVFLRNSASEGGAGAWNDHSFPTFTNCTFSGNAAGTLGGGIGNASSSPIVTNCILWGDSSAAPDGEVYDDESSVSTLTHSCIEGGWKGAGNIVTDPLLIGTLGSKGRIQPASDCIDAGILAGAAATDIRGIGRPQGRGVDVGAYELDDSDGDGVSDAWEIAEFGNLSTASASSDFDTDGATDREESLYDSNPKVADTDDDGTSDRDEIQCGREPTIRPVVRRVDTANVSILQDGLFWSSAFTSIQAAVDDLDGCGEGEVWVAAGTYTGSSDNVVAMKADVFLYGGFAGTEFRKTDRSWETNLTAIDGQGVRRCVLGADHAGLDGFIIRNGFAAGAGMYNVSASPRVANCIFSGNTADTVNGGGMYNDASSPVVVNCTFSGNTSALAHGAGMCNHNGAPKVDHCRFDGNTALGVAHNQMGDAHGGGMYNDAASPVVTNCTFSGNISTMGHGAGIYNGGGSPTIASCVFESNGCQGNSSPAGISACGGGIANFSCEANVADCTFTANTARYGGGIYNGSATSNITRCAFTGNIAHGAYTSNGGGVCNRSSSSSVTHCTFTGNDASGLYFGNGGGMYNESGSLVVGDCTFVTNNAAGSGGGMHNISTAPAVTNCVFNGNTVVGWYNALGGGMYNESGSPRVTNCVFTANVVHDTQTCRGAGMYNKSASPTVTNCTLSGNAAKGGNLTEGGGVYNESSAPILVNCILWDDSPGEIVGDVGGVTYSCIQGGYAGAGNVDYGPRFVDAANGDYTLQSDSPCIDKGTDAGAPETDIFGVTRPQGPGFDIGAYEYASR